MHPVAYGLMIFGAGLTIAGIVLFTRMGTQGTSAIKMFSFEFRLGGSALVVFVLGVLMILFPILY